MSCAGKKKKESIANDSSFQTISSQAKYVKKNGLPEKSDQVEAKKPPLPTSALSTLSRTATASQPTAAAPTTTNPSSVVSGASPLTQLQTHNSSPSYQMHMSDTQDKPNNETKCLREKDKAKQPGNKSAATDNETLEPPPKGQSLSHSAFIFRPATALTNKHKH